MRRIARGSLSSADGTFNASTSWMRATSFTGNLRGTHLAIHEAGHNLGLHHSNFRYFESESLGAPGAGGVLEEYDDAFSAMGRSFGHYAAPHKASLGWLTSQALTVTASGSYVVRPLEVTGAAVQALKIRRGTDNNSWLWLEYRQPVRLDDSKLAAPFVFGLPPNQLFYLDADVSHIYSGGLIHYQDATTGAYTHLLDFTPQSLAGSPSPQIPDDWLDPVLVGTRTDPYNSVSITTSDPTSSGLTVSVTYGPLPCVVRAPTVTLSPANPNGKRGQNRLHRLDWEQRRRELLGEVLRSDVVPARRVGHDAAQPESVDCAGVVGIGLHDEDGPSGRGADHLRRRDHGAGRWCLRCRHRRGHGQGRQVTRHGRK